MTGAWKEASASPPREELAANIATLRTHSHNWAYCKQTKTLSALPLSGKISNKIHIMQTCPGTPKMSKTLQLSRVLQPLLLEKVPTFICHFSMPRASIRKI